MADRILLVLYVFSFRSSVGQVTKLRRTRCLCLASWNSWQNSCLWCFLSWASFMSRGSPEQVKHIDLFSFRSRGRKKERDSYFQNTSAALPSFSQITETCFLVHAPKADVFRRSKQTSAMQPPDSHSHLHSFHLFCHLHSSSHHANNTLCWVIDWLQRCEQQVLNWNAKSASREK